MQNFSKKLYQNRPETSIFHSVWRRPVESTGPLGPCKKLRLADPQISCFRSAQLWTALSLKALNGHHDAMFTSGWQSFQIWSSIDQLSPWHTASFLVKFHTCSSSYEQETWPLFLFLWTGNLTPVPLPMNKKPDTCSSSYEQETWHLFLFLWTGNLTPVPPPLNRKPDTCSCSYEQETGHLFLGTGVR